MAETTYEPSHGAAGPNNELDINFHNMTTTSNFRTLRQTRYRSVEQQLQILARHIEAGCFDLVVSVAASKSSFVVVVQTARSMEELLEMGFPDPPG